FPCRAPPKPPATPAHSSPFAPHRSRSPAHGQSESESGALALQQRTSDSRSVPVAWRQTDDGDATMERFSRGRQDRQGGQDRQGLRATRKRNHHTREDKVILGIALGGEAHGSKTFCESM